MRRQVDQTERDRLIKLARVVGLIADAIQKLAEGKRPRVVWCETEEAKWHDTKSDCRAETCAQQVHETGDFTAKNTARPDRN